jgi:ribulose-phosphate 3-epimerase
MKIIPGILVKTKKELVEKLNTLRGVTKEVQIDLCDGVYVNSKTWPFASYTSTDAMLRESGELSDQIESLSEALKDFSIELDLMVSEPETIFSVWDEFHPERVLIHVDSVADEESLAISLSSLKSQFPWITDHKLGFAISQKTNLSKLDNWYYSFDIRFIQIMGIDPIGAQGSEFQANTFSLIEDLKEKFPGVMVQVDGGVHGEEILALKKAGADSVVMGSAIFAQGNPAENLKRFQDMVQ